MVNSKMKYDLPHIPDELFFDQTPTTGKNPIRSSPTECYVLNDNKHENKLVQLDVHKEFQLNLELCRRNCVVGCCNGLVCFYVDCGRLVKGKFILWNPATKISRVIETPCVQHLAKYGFGYASNIDDYEIFASFESLYRKPGTTQIQAWVFKVRVGEWNPIIDLPTDVGYFPRGDSNATYSGDHLYWIVGGFKDSHIPSFGLSDFKFKDVKFPVIMNTRFKLHVSEGCLTLLSEREELTRGTEIWRLVQHPSGESDSWVKMVTITWYFPRILAFSPTGKCLVQHHLDEVKVVDHVFDEPAHKHVEGVYFDGFPMHAESHVESLVSPF
ncbi:F-box/kelch-repeat protein At3g23880-like [Spinacia oleracea]|uniref:F-box/kelch-repeat protein At3g23880-like n=1 Tax=Spinacia oleracea TaxID=3562 RepID=A0ABM3RQP9_SPIOL|nr:F-box/kelch-repeat protein At3g23880-like [Spinacia oleracea]